MYGGKGVLVGGQGAVDHGKRTDHRRMNLTMHRRARQEHVLHNTGLITNQEYCEYLKWVLKARHGWPSKVDFALALRFFGLIMNLARFEAGQKSKALRNIIQNGCLTVDQAAKAEYAKQRDRNKFKQMARRMGGFQRN